MGLTIGQWYRVTISWDRGVLGVILGTLARGARERDLRSSEMAGIGWVN